MVFREQMERAVYSEDLDLLKDLLNEVTLGVPASTCSSSTPDDLWRVLPIDQDGGLAPLHHLVLQEWWEGLDYYHELSIRLNALRLMMNVRTTDRIIRKVGTA